MGLQADTCSPMLSLSGMLITKPAGQMLFYP